MGITRDIKMKIFALIGSALALGPQFPNEMNTNDYFWIKAASSSRPAGISQINNIKCMRNIQIEGAGRGEKHTKTCNINFEALDTSSGYSDVLNSTLKSPLQLVNIADLHQFLMHLQQFGVDKPINTQKLFHMAEENKLFYFNKVIFNIF